MIENMVAEALVGLVKRPPKTQAEKAFHEWLLLWHQKIQSKTQEDSE